MKLEDLKVIDIIQMPQFEKHIEALIKDLYLTRTKIMNRSPYVQFKRGPNKRSYKPAGKYAAHKCTICRNKTTIIYIY